VKEILMILTNAQRAAVLAKTTKVVKEWKCESCGAAGQWIVSDRIYYLTDPFPQGTLEVSAPMVFSPKTGLIPLIPIYCRTCGNTRFYNALVLGLVDGTGRWVDEKKEN
jgi:hypothetical protein